MEAKLLAVTEVERTPTSKLTPKSANYGWQPLRDVLLIMLDTGMRPAEVFRMEWEHVRWDRELIFVPCGKSRKSKRYVPPKRYVPLSERVKEALQMRAQESPFIFPSARSGSGHIGMQSHTDAAVLNSFGVVLLAVRESPQTHCTKGAS